MNNQPCINLFEIQYFSLHDGPGIRTTCFLKACPLRCKWCHNPESFEKEPVLEYWEELCIGCMRCIKVCPTGAHRFERGNHIIDRMKCIRCGACADVCPTIALEMKGRCIGDEELLYVLTRDQKLFSVSGGGVTFSGGEPLLQYHALGRIARQLKAQGIHVAVDTSAQVPKEAFSHVLDTVDLFLVDIKLINPQRHRQFTGMDNRQILENTRYVAKNAPVIIRIPLIANVNDSLGEIKAFSEFIGTLDRVKKVEVLLYHDLGVRKYRALGLTADVFQAPEQRIVQTFLELLKERGIFAEIH